MAFLPGNLLKGVPQKKPESRGFFFAEPLLSGFFAEQPEFKEENSISKNGNFSKNTFHAFESDSSVRISFQRNKDSEKKTPRKRGGVFLLMKTIIVD